MYLLYITKTKKKKWENKILLDEEKSAFNIYMRKVWKNERIKS